jgi:hypothetical protein
VDFRDTPAVRQKRRRNRRTIGFMPLEPRIMYDGAAAASAAVAHHHADHHDGDHHDAHSDTQGSSSPGAPATSNQWHNDAKAAEPMPQVATSVKNPTEIVFIDTQAPDYQELVAGANPGVEVVLLNPNSDGLQQIADFLARHPDPNLTSIAIVGHGDPGEFTIGSTNLTADNLAGEAQSLAAIGKALGPNGDILLYGCDVAEGTAGLQFISGFSTYAGGAHVAASTKAIGTLQTNNGTFENWTLDASTGPIDAATPFTAAALAAYQGLLPTTTTVTASSVTTTLTLDADGDGGISPGDTVTGQVTITNTTGTAATGVAFTETANGFAATTGVTITALGVADSYSLTGNTPIKVSATSGVLANDIDFNGDALTVSAVNGSAAHVGTAIAVTDGTLTLNADGSFTFTPTTGFSGTTSFTYTAHDAAAGDADQTTTVTLTVTAPVWYVDSAAASGGDGSYNHAFQTVGAAVSAAATDTNSGVNNIIFVENAGSTYTATSGITLVQGEQLLGDGSSLTSVNGNSVGLSSSNPIFEVSGGTTNAVTLNSGNTISGINISNEGSGDGIVNGSVGIGTLTMSNIAVGTGSGTGISLVYSTNTISNIVDITGTGNTIHSASGTALDITNTNIGSSGVTFESISSGSGSNDGIVLDDTGASGGLTVTGDGSTAGSGGAIEGKTGTTGGATNGIGIYLNATADVSIAYMQLYNLSYDGIYGQSVTNFSMDHTVVYGANGSAVGEGSVIFGSGQYGGGDINGITGVASITNSTISGGWYDNVDVFDWSGLLNITFNNDTFGDNNTTHGNQNVYIAPAGTSVINATLTNSHWTGVAGGSNFYFNVESGSSTGSNLSFIGNVVADDRGGSGGDGGSGTVEAIASSFASTSTFDIENNAFTGANGNAVIVANDQAGSPTTTATLNLTFSGNTIGAAAGTNNPSTTDGFGSAGGMGLWVEFNGGTMNATVANNYIYEFATNGIEFQGGLATTGNEAGTLNATVIGNTIEDPSSSAGSKGALQVGIYVEPGPNDGGAINNSYAFNLTIGGSTSSEQNTINVPQNEINTSFDAADIEMTQDGDRHSPDAINLTAETGTAGSLSTYGGLGDDSSLQVEAFLASNNITSNSNGYAAAAANSNGYGGGLPSATAPVTGPTFGTPTIGGADTEGSTLTASVIGGSGIAYQWQEAFSNGEWVDISGANSSSFTLSEAQVGATLRVVETAVYSGGLVDTAASAATAVVTDNLTLTPPGISGTDTVGQVLTASTPTVNNSDAAITYQWQDNGVNISGATGQTYRVSSSDVGDTIDVVATAKDPHGGDVSQTSAATATVTAFTAQSLSSVSIGTLPGNDAVTVSWEATVKGQSDQLIVNPTYTSGSVTGGNFTTVTIPTTTVTLDTLSLEGEIFGDTNGNGILDAGENGISGVSLSVYTGTPGSGTLIESTTTNAGGDYDFTGLAAGNYYVQVNALPSGYTGASTVVDTTPNDYLGGRNYGLAASGGVVDTNPITIAYDKPQPTGATTYPGDDTTDTLDIGLVKGPAIGGAGNTIDFYQNGAALTVDSGITVTDAANISGATVTITDAGSVVPGDLLSFTSQFGITGGYNAATGVLSLSGSASAADYATVLDSITYSFTGDPTVVNTEHVRTVTYTVSDANSLSSPAVTNTIDTFALPIVSVGTATTPTVTTTSGAVVADSTVSVLDYNGSTLAGATVVISGDAQTGDTLTDNGISTGGIVLGNIHATFNSGTDTLTLSGTDTVANYIKALDEVQFDAVNPNNGTRTLTWTVDDEAGSHTNDSTPVTTSAVVAFGPQITGLVGQPVNGGAVDLTGTGITVGDTINLYADNDMTTIVGTGKVDSGDTFNIITTADYPDGKHTFTAVETNSSNPTIPASQPFVVEVESLAPTGLTQAGTIPSNGGTIEISGTGDASGDTIKLYATDNHVTTLIATGTAGAGGAFDITATGPFPDGTYSVTATDTSIDGTQTSAQSIAVNAVVTSVAPTGLAQLGTPTNGGTIDITGTGDASGDTIKLYATDNHVTTLIATGTAGANGAFNLTATGPFPDGTYSVTATDTSADGTQTSAQSIALTVNVDPTAPVITAQVGQPVNGGTVELLGTGEAGETINLYADGKPTIVGTGTVSAGGTFDITTTATFTDGVHTFTATEKDAANLTSAASPAFPVDVAPTLSASGTVTYVQNGSPIQLDATATADLGDPGGPLAGATVSIGSGFYAGDALNFANQNGISGSYDAVHGVLTLTGSASVADYNAALDSITFSSSSPNPSNDGANLTRTISWSVIDANKTNAVSATVTSTVSVQAVPTVVAGADVNYQAIPGQSVVLDPTIVAYDGTSLTGATVTIASGFQSGEVLSANTSGTNITASYSNGVLTLTGKDTPQDYQSVLNSVALSGTPAQNGPATIDWQVSDQNRTSQIATSTVDVAASVAPPRVGAVQVQIAPNFGHGQFGDFSGMVTNVNAQAGVGLSFGTGNAFYLVHTDVNAAVADNGSIDFDLPLAQLEAALGGDVVSVTATLADGKPLPGWLQFNSDTGQFAGLVPDNIATGSITPDGGMNGQPHGTGPLFPQLITIEVVARDSHGNLAITEFTIDLSAQTQHKGEKHGWNVVPSGPHRDIALPPAMDRVLWHAAPALDADRVQADRGPDLAPAGRAGFSDQIKAHGWHAATAQRMALLDSLRQGVAGWR